MENIDLSLKKENPMEVGRIESFLKKYPIYQFAIVPVSEIPFSEKVRDICKHECERYGTSWSCPPAVGTVEECKKRCMNYKFALIFSTVAETDEAYDLGSVLKTQTGHEDITLKLADRIAKDGNNVFALSSNSCSLCRECTYPDGKCRFPHHMHPCIESYGIVVVPLLEKLEMDYSIGEKLVLWFSILFIS